MLSSCPRYFPSSPSDFGGSFKISCHFNYCSANPGFSASPRVWHENRPICSRRSLSQNWFFFFPVSADERSSHFCLRVLANHLASIFFLSLVTKCKHLLAFTLTHILYFLRQVVRNWPILLFCLNGHSLGELLTQIRRSRGHSLSLFPQWLTTGHKTSRILSKQHGGFLCGFSPAFSPCVF